MYVTPSAPIRPISLRPFANDSDLTTVCTADSHEGHDHPNVSSPHMNDITSVSIPLSTLESEDELRSGQLYRLLRDLIWEGVLPARKGQQQEQPDARQNQDPSESVGQGDEGEFDLLRTKGFFRVVGSPDRCFVLQGVRNAFEITEVPADLDKGDEDGIEDGKRIESKIVLIGKGLGNGVEIRRRFLDALTKAT